MKHETRVKLHLPAQLERRCVVLGKLPKPATKLKLKTQFDSLLITYIQWLLQGSPRQRTVGRGV